MKECILFVRNSLNYVGGIETYIYKAIKQIACKGDGVGWISNNFENINDAFKDMTINFSINLIKRSNAIKQIKSIVVKEKYDKVLIITFCPHDFCYAERLKNKLNCLSVYTFMFIPHFQGDVLYLEDGFHFGKGYFRKRLGAIYQRMEVNKNLRYFAPRHLEEFKKRYGCKETEYKNVQIPNILDQIAFNTERVKKVYNQLPFNILCVSRMEFPHKGFVLGLIDDFEKLCKKYDFMKMTIIGDGRDMGRLKKKISGLDETVKKKIQVVGSVSPAQLGDYYDQANVLISVAGCFTLGARRGVLSIPARHYTECCEVYGYLPESKSYTLSTAKGKSVISYIEDIAKMTYEDYFKHCQACYETFSYLNDRSLDFDSLTNESTQTMSLSETILIESLAIHNKILSVLQNRKS